MYRNIVTAAFATIFAFPLAVLAASETANPAVEQAATADAYTEGEIKKIDVEQGKVTIKHGPIDNLGMPGMTMVFRVPDPATLAKLKVGDAVVFKADRAAGAFHATELKVR